MIVVPQSAELIALTFPVKPYGDGFIPDLGDVAAGELCSPPARVVERSGRVCWKSEGRAGVGSAAGFLERVVKKFGHQSIAEHASATMVLVTDRIVSHQLVRARIAAYSQESTHYINYAKGGPDRTIRVCRPLEVVEGSEDDLDFLEGCAVAEQAYFRMVDRGVKHYTARYVLPMALKTEVVATYNFRMWDHVLRQRTDLKNTPEIRALMRLAGKRMASACPELFGEWA